MIPRHTPWEALVSGVNAGAQIAANRQRGRALEAQIGHQAFQETVLKQKADADAQDLKTLQEWWPTFASAEGEALANLKVPPIKNGTLWNQITMEVGKKRQQAAASDLANNMAGLNLETPEGQTAYYDLVSKAAKTGLPLTIDQIQGPVDKAREIKRLRDTAAETARHNAAMEGRTPQIINEEKANAFRLIADELEVEDPELAADYRRRSDDLRSTLLAGVTKDPSQPTTSTKSQIQQRMLTADKTLELGAQLMERLTGADVGVRGNINQVVINEGLAQLFPGMGKGSVTEARTLLGQFNEQAIKAIASDPRISDKDRARYERILPSLGAVESLSSAQDKIKTFMQKFREQTRTDAKAAGLPVPNWSLTVDELKAKIKAGEMSEDEGVQILMRYH